MLCGLILGHTIQSLLGSFVKTAPQTQGSTSFGDQGWAPRGSGTQRDGGLPNMPGSTQPLSGGTRTAPCELLLGVAHPAAR